MKSFPHSPASKSASTGVLLVLLVFRIGGLKGKEAATAVPGSDRNEEDLVRGL
jgi:hypothetical protein